MMNDRTELVELWKELAEEQVENAAKPAGYWPGGLVLASLTHFSLPSLIIEVLGDNFEFDLKVQGLEISKRQLEVSGRLANCIQISPSKEEATSIFVTLSDHLIQALREEEFAGGSTVDLERAITVWVEFMKELRGDSPREKIIGLIGELLTIRDVLNTDNLDASCWQGPLGGIQDFVSENDALEVKTGTNRNGALHHRISGLYQLRPPHEGKLYIQSFRIALGQKGEEKLVDLVQEVHSSRLFQSAKAKLHFEECLVAAGYSDEIDISLSQFSILDSKTYLVTDDFPRLDPSNTNADSRILEVKYSLDFSQLDEYSIGMDEKKLTLR